MPRNYDRLIRYYDSWFDDINDPDKELSGEEKWQILLALRECQRVMSADPLRKLPLRIRRALSMATMIEQVERIIERCESARSRGSRGGQATQAKNQAEERAQNVARIDRERAEMKAAIPQGYTSLSWYNELKARAKKGDPKAIEELKKM